MAHHAAQAHPDAPTALTPVERERLATLERTVERGLATFLEVGSALAEIRDSRLYRERHSTFDAYCRHRWQMGRTRAYQLMGAAEVVGGLSTIVDKLPANEAQARPLTALQPDDRRAAWEDAVETAQADGRAQPTARHVEEAVNRHREPEPEPDEPDAEPEIDPFGEWERAEKEVERLTALVDSLQASDLHKEILAWSAKFAQLNGRLMQEVTKANEATRTAKYATRLLARIREKLGVERNTDILPALDQLT